MRTSMPRMAMIVGTVLLATVPLFAADEHEQRT